MSAEKEAKQSRRRSFFLFGGVSHGKSEQSVPNSKINKAHQSKNIKSKAPLEKQPLSNKNPFVDDHDKHKDTVEQKIPKGNSSLERNVSQPNTTLRSSSRESTNPFLGDFESDYTRGRMTRARRPPPPIDMDAVKIFTQTAPLNINPAPNISPPNSTNETLKSISHSPMDTPGPPNKEKDKNQHRRQKSEAEKLVDDLESYIKQNEEGIGSPDSEVEGSHSEDDIESSKRSDVRSDHSIDSPFTSVGPLSTSVNERVTSSREPSLKLKSDLSSEVDTDRFSFTVSLNDKSVNSIQQVTMSEADGSAPVVSSAVYNCSPERDESDDDDLVIKEAGRAQHIEDGLLQTENTEVFEQSESVDDVPRRTFRVVNEDRPKFYLQTEDNTTMSMDTNTTTTTDDDDNDGDDDEMNAPSETLSQSYSGRNGRTSSSVGSNGIYPVNSAVTGDSRTNISEQVERYTEFSRVEPPLQEGALTVEEDLQRKVTTPQLSDKSNPSMKSSGSNHTSSSASSKPDKTVRLVSSYVEELRLKYYKTSNFLAAPPNLPITLKQKNNLIQPKNIKVRIRTSSKQIGIKHGGAKQKLLSLETTKEDSRESLSGVKFQDNKNKINVDHTKEFHELLSKGGLAKTSNESDSQQVPSKNDEDLDYYLNEIPGDDAYDSDDAMAPLREKGKARDAKNMTRSNTVVSYYTKNQRRLRSGTLENSYAYLQKLPTNININDYENQDIHENNGADEPCISDESSSLGPVYSYGQGLHVANPDSDSE